MTADDRIGYGMKNGQLIFISQVARGLNCGCTCAQCGQPLVAKKGSIRQHHFAHFSASSCQGAAETVLHALAKELLADLNEITIPPYEFIKQRKTKNGAIVQQQSIVVKGGSVRIDEVRIEAPEGNFIPDVVIASGSKQLLVEVAVTHQVSRAKLRKIRRRDLPAIEIRLGPADALLERETLRAKLQHDLNSKQWLFHPRQRKAERMFFAKLRGLISHNRIASLSPASTSSDTTGPSRRAHPPVRASWSEHDRTAEEFNRIHQRYPTLDECLRLWPHLWKKR